ncbi:MAG TPA: divalent-cation tolerance protein CutA [archaeon]|nr:divalent-cation tolerance protein CutA [archaeon]
MTYSVVLCTCKDEKEAQKIANHLLHDELIACANIVENIKSLYWWEGKITSSSECMIIMKTKKSLVEDVISSIKKMHSYKVPEVIELPIGNGNKDYLNWISEVTKR